jgi:hypothetical protein
MAVPYLEGAVIDGVKRLDCNPRPGCSSAEARRTARRKIERLIHVLACFMHERARA